MTRMNHSIAIGSVPAVGAYLRDCFWKLLGRNFSRAPRPIRVEFDSNESQGRVYGCFDAVMVRR